MFCRYCGKKIERKTKFCPYCGQNIKKVHKVQNYRKYVVLLTIIILILLTGVIVVRAEVPSKIVQIIEDIKEKYSVNEGDYKEDTEEDVNEGNDDEPEDTKSNDVSDEEAFPQPMTQEEKQLFWQVLQVMPFELENWSTERLAEHFMVSFHLENRDYKSIEIGPLTIETGTAQTPVDLGYDGISAGEESEYIRCHTEQMEDFLEDIYGQEFMLASGELLYPEVRNEDGYLWEWGNAYLISYEGFATTYEEPEYVQEGEFLTIKIPYYSYDVMGYGRKGVVESIWNYNPESFLGYTLDTEKILYTEELVMTEEEVEGERIRIRDAIANGNTMQIILEAGTDEIPWARQLNFEDGELVFAYYYDSQNGEEDQRFYFYDDVMIRWVVGTSPNQTFYNISDDVLPKEWKQKETECLNAEKTYR